MIREYCKKKKSILIDMIISLEGFIPRSTGVYANVGSHRRPSAKFALATKGSMTDTAYLKIALQYTDMNLYVQAYYGRKESLEGSKIVTK